MFIFMLLAFISIRPVFGEETSSGQKLIKYVDVKNNKTVSGATILSKLKTKKGDAFYKRVVENHILLYGSGLK